MKKKTYLEIILCTVQKESKIVQKKGWGTRKRKSIDRSRPALEQLSRHSISNYSTISSPVFRSLPRSQIYLFHLPFPLTRNKLKLECIQNFAENHQSREEYVYVYTNAHNTIQR